MLMLPVLLQETCTRRAGVPLMIDRLVAIVPPGGSLGYVHANKFCVQQSPLWAIPIL
jgi:hypothetical protein